MDPQHFLKDIADRICDSLPPSLQTMKKDWEKNIHSILVGTFTKLDLVTREEFDSQTKVLARTRKKVETLEAKIKELEHIIQEQSK